SSTSPRGAGCCQKATATGCCWAKTTTVSAARVRPGVAAKTQGPSIWERPAHGPQPGRGGRGRQRRGRRHRQPAPGPRPAWPHRASARTGEEKKAMIPLDYVLAAALLVGSPEAADLPGTAEEFATLDPSGRCCIRRPLALFSP